ncbi:MAG: hypothetical protein KC488_04475, partial [Candidatus Cloacimonetes bacterium]|nr:hypothetical protein [Candidatus Cloacimonadota bacterium]
MPKQIRRWPWLLAMPFLLSCADNRFEEDEVILLTGLELPEQVVVGRTAPYEIKALVQLPAAEDILLRVNVELQGPGFEAVYELADDGGAFTLADTGPGQLSHSGDNVPGDGVYTLSLDAAFHDSVGVY